MKTFRKILQETVDEYSTKGHADLKIRRNDPRFGDNPLEYGWEELDEFSASGTVGDQATLDRLHNMLNKFMSDQEIRQSVQLTDEGLHKAAAALGTSPEGVKTLLATLTQHLRDDDETNTLEERYRWFMEAVNTTVPFDDDDDDQVSAEPDYLGNMSVRSAHSGQSHYYQGSQAAAIKNKLATAQSPEQKQEVLKPLVEQDDDDDSDGKSYKGGYADEINSDKTGSYNFPWKYQGKSGFGSVAYRSVNGKPDLKLISVRDAAGDDMRMDSTMQGQILQQARQFIADA